MSMSTLERRPLLLIAASALAFDQVSKVIVAEQLADGRSIQAIPGLLNLLLECGEALTREFARS